MAPQAVIPFITGGDENFVAFPSQNSAQRQQSSSPTSLSQPTPSRLMPSSMNGLRAPPTPKMGRLDAPVARKKVVLGPGYSPLDWARLKTTSDLRGGVSSLLRVTPSELKKHNKLEDAWTAIQGKVYNITPYLKFHPGGVEKLMCIAGRDGTQLFYTTHPWVNVDALIDSTMVGLFVPD